MGKPLTGVEFGSAGIHLAAAKDGVITKTLTVALPEGLVSDGRITSLDAAGDFVKKLFRENRGFPKDIAIVLSPSESLVRTLDMPPMSEKELLINLPYEFRDYIAQGKDRYSFDYAMLGVEYDEDDKPVSMHVLGCAAPKQTIKDYEDLFARAGMNLRAAVPLSASYQEMMQEQAADRTVCLLDLGNSYTRLFFFDHGSLSVSRNIEVAGRDIDRAIAAELNVDEFIAAGYKQNNYNGVLDSEQVTNVYTDIAVEIGRAMNFYAFSNPDLTMDAIYYCGGCTCIPQLLDRIRDQVSVPLLSAAELLNNVPEDDPSMLCMAASCVALGGVN